MSKAEAIAYYERIILLRIQLFLRAVAFAGTILIFGRYQAGILGKLLANFGLQDSYPTALLTLLIVSAFAATIDFPIRFIYKRIKNRLSIQRK